MSDDVIFCSVHGASSPANIGCIACDRERQRELESLRAKLAGARQAIGLLTTLAPSMEIDANDPVGMAQEIVRVVSEKDKRIEDLEMALFRWEQGGKDDGIFFITDEQIDAAWHRYQNFKKMVDIRRASDATRLAAECMKESFEDIGIVACPECGGSGLWPPPQPAQDEPCPSCHNGWVRKE